MNIQDRLNEINRALANRKPVTKTSAPKPATIKTPDVSALRAQIAGAHKQLATAFEQAKQLKAQSLYAQINNLGVKLTAMQSELKKLS
jgi:hypothetical protein